MSMDVPAIVAEVKQVAQSIYGDRLDAVVLFGSFARGDAGPGSDIDLLVVLSGPVDPGREIARMGPQTAALSLRHDVVISCVFVAADRYDTEQSPLLMNIRREGIAA